MKVTVLIIVKLNCNCINNYKISIIWIIIKLSYNYEIYENNCINNCKIELQLY